MLQRMINTRKDHDETQQQLANALGIHRTEVARYETGVNSPKIEYLVKFCNHYKVSADFILGLPDDYKKSTY